MTWQKVWKPIIVQCDIHKWGMETLHSAQTEDPCTAVKHLKRHYSSCIYKYIMINLVTRFSATVLHCLTEDSKTCLLWVMFTQWCRLYYRIWNQGVWEKECSCDSLLICFTHSVSVLPLLTLSAEDVTTRQGDSVLMNTESHSSLNEVVSLSFTVNQLTEEFVLTFCATFAPLLFCSGWNQLDSNNTM